MGAVPKDSSENRRNILKYNLNLGKKKEQKTGDGVHINTLLSKQPSITESLVVLPG